MHDLRIGFGRVDPPSGIFPSLRHFSSVTRLTLNYVSFHSITDIRRTISSLAALNYLSLSRLRWSIVEPPQRIPTGFPPSNVRLSTLQIVAEGRAWLLDSRSVYLIEWFGRSGVASRLRFLFAWAMMILDTRMLAAVVSIIDAAKETLEEIGPEFGPEVPFGSGMRATSVIDALAEFFLPY